MKNISKTVTIYLCILSILGWLFPEPLWGDGVVGTTDESGQVITEAYSPEEMETMLEEAGQVEYRSRLGEVFSGLWDKE